MFLAWRDLRVARGRFALVGGVIALVSLLSTALSGLANGLVDDGISGLRRLPLTHLAFTPNSDANFSRSMLTEKNLTPWKDALGGDVAPVGVSFFNLRTVDGRTLDVSMFGTDAGSFLADTNSEHEQAQGALSGEPGIVLSSEMAEDGVAIGDVLTVVGPDTELPVLGFTYSGTYGHADIAFTSLETWQELVYGDNAKGRFSAIAIRDTGAVDLEDLSSRTEVEVLTKSESYKGSPGYSAETATMTLIRSFLIIIAALIVGAFFTVWTIQRSGQIGLLKALGASNRYVITDALGQLAVVLVASTTLGVLLATLLGLSVSGSAPFRLTPGSVVSSALLLIAAGMIGALVALRRITSIPPDTALRESI